MTAVAFIAQIRQRFLLSWIMVRIMGLAMAVKDVNLVYVFFIASGIALTPVISKLLFSSPNDIQVV